MSELTLPLGKSPSPTGRGLLGHLHLRCALDSRGVSSLQEQSFRAPFHISKPHWEDPYLVVNVANPTAGMLEGDRIECRVAVDRAAKLVLTTPAANRSFRMKGGEATVQQTFTVAVDAWLEYWPELLIPQAGTRYRQQTRIEVAPGGSLLFAEALAPGRVASGEAFAYQSLQWETDLHVGSQQVARERYTLQPGSASLAALRGRFPSAYYASCFIVSPNLLKENDCWAEIHELHSDALWIGCSELGASSWIVKMVTNSSIELRRALAQVRVLLYAALQSRAPDLRRVTGVI